MSSFLIVPNFGRGINSNFRKKYFRLKMFFSFTRGTYSYFSVIDSDKKIQLSYHEGNKNLKSNH